MTRSQAGLAIGGVLLVIGTVAGGLGLCALIPLTQNFNAITTQVLPFIALAIGVNSMFFLNELDSVLDTVLYFASLLVFGELGGD